MSGTEFKERFLQLLIRWVIVVVPTVVIGYLTVRLLNQSFTLFQTGVLHQTFYFGLGVLIAYSLYFFRARWFVTLILLWIVLWGLGKVISHLPGEFDVFYATARFQLFSTLFLFGWVFGFLLARWRWSYVILFGVLTLVTLVSVSNTVDITITYVLVNLAPVLVYGLYMLFLSPLLSGTIVLDRKQSVRLGVRIVLFAMLIILALFATAHLFRSDFKAVDTELGARGAKNEKDSEKKDQKNQDDRNGLMEKSNDDDGYRLKDTMRVNSKMSQSDKLMFCSKLDNFMPDGSPAPLYFVYHYLTRFDSVRQSFTRDVNVPSFDEFDVDPVNLPMYYSITDTTILRKSMASKYRKMVEAQVYLSENTWKHSVLGPASVFSIQTIPVEKDFQKTFLTAYKITSFVSDMNNAYFVYNISVNPILTQLQEKRHEELRSVKGYGSVNRKFMEYYTRTPSGGIYDSIRNLAKSLVPANTRPVDKVIAVRDFFLKRRENGDRVFRYSLNAGGVDDPNIPSTKMLYNFLFKTHEGYCTYYAGASLFMLRELGIPARFTTGFAAVNRSDKNKGWYWFYASQAHAWTQVYFPEYGWLDFDMTIGNEDQQSAPKPDGTPPLPPPDPLFVLNAKAESVDVAAKKVVASFSELIYLNQHYVLTKPMQRTVDASLCRVLFNKRDTTLLALHAGDSLIIISYKDETKPNPKPGAVEEVMSMLPSPFVADEIHVRGMETVKKKSGRANSALDKPSWITWQQAAWIAGIGLATLILLLFLFPALYLCYLLVRVKGASTPHSKADHLYRAALFRFHMTGIERENSTPLEYAKSKIDPVLHADFEAFMHVYLRMKYANAPFTPEQGETIQRFAKKIGPSIRQKFGIHQRAGHYLHVLLALRYFQQPPNQDYENLPL